jgi:DUF4097 and DUF4098 domain-containing protein YvlB
MLVPMMALVLALGAPVAAADTLLPVDRGTRLDIEAQRGRVEVRGWAQDAVRVQTSNRARADVARVGSLLRVRPESNASGARDTDFVIHAPVWMDVRISGQQVAASVRGTEGEVTIETMGGDILVDGRAGRVSVNTIQGAVNVRNARGPVEVWSVGQSVTLTDITGDVTVETTNGGITMRGVRAATARATTVNGSIVYDGTIRPDGRYAFTTHNGAISVHIPENANATVSAATYNGTFESDFPVRFTGTSRDRHYNFTLGSGSARVELESFNGNIRLRRPR